MFIVISLLPSCAAILPTYGGKPPQARGEFIKPSSPWNDYRGIIHCHSHWSHDSQGSEEEIIRAAQQTGVDFLIMTDHYTDQAILGALRGFHGQTLFLAGVEFNKDGKSFLALGLQTPLDLSQPLEQIIEQIHSQGGLVFLDHIEKNSHATLTTIPCDGWEIYNLHAAAKEANVLGTILFGLFLPPQFLFCHFAAAHSQIARWENAIGEKWIPAIAGNDAHQNIQIFGPLGGTIGTYEEVLRTVSTHVWAESLTPKAILDALKNGRSYICFDILRDGSGFFVEKLSCEEQTCLRIFFPQAAKLTLYREGKEYNHSSENQIHLIPVEKGNYTLRGELHGKLWIVAGPIKVE